jgi:hypothetical protein
MLRSGDVNRPRVVQAKLGEKRLNHGVHVKIVIYQGSSDVVSHRVLAIYDFLRDCTFKRELHVLQVFAQFGQFTFVLLYSAHS